MIYSHALWFCTPRATAMQTCFMSSAFWWKCWSSLLSFQLVRRQFNLQTLQCFAAQLVMVVRCVTAVTLLNKKCVKCTTLSMAVEALGAELKRACHGDSHSQGGKMASAYWLHQTRSNAFFARQTCDVRLVKTTSTHAL